jgi:hypothetical protein
MPGIEEILNSMTNFFENEHKKSFKKKIPLNGKAPNGKSKIEKEEVSSTVIASSTTTTTAT